MNGEDILIDIILDITPEKVKKKGNGREYFESMMISKWWPDINEVEKKLVLGMIKSTIDRAFPVKFGAAMQQNIQELQMAGRFADVYLIRIQGISEKRRFTRFSVTKPVICYRYGRHMNMRSVNISLGGIELVLNFELRVGESMDIAILTNGTRIRCKGRILGIEDFKHKVHARLRFVHISDKDFQEFSHYLNTISQKGGKQLKKGVIIGILVLASYIAYINRVYLFGGANFLLP